MIFIIERISDSVMDNFVNLTGLRGGQIAGKRYLWLWLCL